MPANFQKRPKSAVDKAELRRNLREAAQEMLTESIHHTIDQKVNQKMNQRVNAAIDASVAKSADKVARTAAKKIEQLDRLANHLDALDVWTRSEPGSRRPRFTREEIATTAIRIADTEGFDAVSMRRIAVELGAGTMTLYHYVRTKDELLALVMDTMMAELVVPDGEMPEGWREAVTVVANRSRAMLQRHPWVLDINDDPNLGPNSVRHFDQSLQAVSGLDVGLEERLDIITMVDEYVFGYCLHERTNFHGDPGGEAVTEMLQYVGELASSGDYPQLAALMDEHGTEEAWARVSEHAARADRFDRSLARILDGFEAEFGRAKRTRS